MSDELTIDVQSFGPDQAVLDELAAMILARGTLSETLGRNEHRLLSIEVLDEPGRKLAKPHEPQRFRATLYDYTRQVTLFAEGSLNEPQKLAVTESGVMPIPSPEEFAAAVEVVMCDKELGPMLGNDPAKAYAPMPPLIVDDEAGSGLRRVVAVGLLPARGKGRHEIVGVDLAEHSVIRFDARSPATARAANAICGRPNAAQPTASKGTAGQVRVTVRRGGTVLWRFVAVRPAASSGTNGSGIELRHVDYRGKRVLYRAHVPILNVKYDGNACGPYLDWQYEEGMIRADGVDVAPGFRLCSSPAKTILDTGDDTGNFLGVGIYVDGLEVVLVSEMQAGWYRYVSEWRLHADGTIRPRFGFSAVSSSCVCNVHHHHVYWRLDFDIRIAGKNVVREYNEWPWFGQWHTKRFETQRPRSPQFNRRWQVRNTATGEAYDIVPGPDDGVATASPDWPFPQGDVWIVRYRGSEIDNGVHATGPPYEANIGNFVNGESIENTDVVVWYGAHFTHDVNHEAPGEFGHVVGPELRNVDW
jgi:hypothetical protein